jgi:hypothetical protein
MLLGRHIYNDKDDSMTDYLTTIGIPFDDSTGVEDLILLAAQTSPLIGTELGGYVRWLCGSGPELWLQVDEYRQIVGIGPHFTGNALMSVLLERRMATSDPGPMSGCFYAWADPDNSDSEPGRYPFIFDAPDYLCQTDFLLPQRTQVQLAGFAVMLKAYRTDAEFETARVGKAELPPEMFLPAGLIYADPEDPEPPQSVSVVTGRVLQTALLTNPITKLPFYWAHIKTLGGEIDLVAHPSILEGNLVEDGVILSCCRLTGRIVHQPRAAPAPGDRTGL